MRWETIAKNDPCVLSIDTLKTIDIYFRRMLVSVLTQSKERKRQNRRMHKRIQNDYMEIFRQFHRSVRWNVLPR